MIWWASVVVKLSLGVVEVWIFAIVSHRGARGLWGATMDEGTAVVGLALCVAVAAAEGRPGNEVWLNRLTLH